MALASQRDFYTEYVIRRALSDETIFSSKFDVQGTTFVLIPSIFRICSEIESYFEIFLYQQLTCMQNKCEIRNQHKQLYRIPYILSKIFSNEIRPQGTTGQKGGEGEQGSNLVGKYFLIKYVLSDTTTYADSEFHIYFA